MRTVEVVCGAVLCLIGAVILFLGFFGTGDSYSAGRLTIVIGGLTLIGGVLLLRAGRRSARK